MTPIEETPRLLPAPYRWHAATLPLTPDEVEERLRAWTSRSLGGPSFHGRVGHGKLRLMRNTGYQNSFLPVLFGRVEPTSGGCLLRFRLGLHPLVAVMMVGLVAFILWMWRYSLALPTWVWVLMIGFPVVASVVSYLWEGPKLLRLVADCLEVDPGELGL